MPHLTCFEAKQIAAYLRASCSLVPKFTESPKHGQWLNAISQSCGYRDWNTMVAIAPDVPDDGENGWHGAFFGVARVLIKGQDASEHLVWFRNRDSSRHVAAASLAQSVSARVGKLFHRVDFHYSQPATGFAIEAATMDRVRRWSKFPWSAEAPIISTSANQEITILLWWLKETFTIEPEREHRFSFHSLSFDDDGSPPTGWASEVFNPESLTDSFLSNLTGLVRPKRTCLYVPELANGPNGEFIPVVVKEGSREAELSEFNFGDDQLAAQSYVKELNFKNGVTNADKESISRRFREFEPQEEEYFEDYGVFSDSD